MHILIGKISALILILDTIFVSKMLKMDSGVDFAITDHMKINLDAFIMSLYILKNNDKNVKKGVICWSRGSRKRE